MIRNGATRSRHFRHGRQKLRRFPEEAETAAGSQPPKQDRRIYDRPVNNSRPSTEDEKERIKGR
jgi:hypothetical protein